MQRRRVRAGHVQGPRADGAQPAPADRGHRHRRLRDRRERRLHLHPRRVRAAGRRARRGDRRGLRGAATSARTSSAPASTVDSSCTAAPAPTSAARRPALLESLEGKRGKPRIKPPFPAVQGLYQGPTLVNNVETLSTLPHIIEQRRRVVRRARRREPTGTKLVSVSRPREAAGQLRDRARHAAPRAHLRPRRRPARRAARSSSGSPAARRSPVLTRRPPRPALRLRHDGRRPARCSARARSSSWTTRTLVVDVALQARALLRARVVRQVHAVPRGHELDREDPRAHRRAATATPMDLDIMASVQERIIGNCLCVLGDAMAMPVGSMIAQVPRRVRGAHRGGARARGPRRASTRRRRPRRARRRGGRLMPRPPVDMITFTLDGREVQRAAEHDARRRRAKTATSRSRSSATSRSRRAGRHVPHVPGRDRGHPEAPGRLHDRRSPTAWSSTPHTDARQGGAGGGARVPAHQPPARLPGLRQGRRVPAAGQDVRLGRRHLAVRSSRSATSRSRSR